MSENRLEIRDLHARVAGGEEILKGVDLIVPAGEVHALMGQNGSGKSTLAKVIAGDPSYEVTGGDVLVDGTSVLEMEPDERAREGLYLAFQYPVEVPGVSIANFLRMALNAKRDDDDEIGVMEFYEKLQQAVAALNWDEAIIERNLHEGFSGGEKKRSEILQLLVLEPRYAILDETDSGLDVDALKTVSQGVNAARGPGFGALVITHYQRLLNYIVPDRVHVMSNGRVITSGDKELAIELDTRGYDWIKDEVAAASA
ncbi:MAG: Fe-S cluster assembly ATPase SufC [Trueperaceae bacterium]|nr:Fe-S cluster assembly ATPase SufC [Trueperaceae bacterium]